MRPLLRTQVEAREPVYSGASVNGGEWREYLFQEEQSLLGSWAGLSCLQASPPAVHLAPQVPNHCFRLLLRWSLRSPHR